MSPDTRSLARLSLAALLTVCLASRPAIATPAFTGVEVLGSDRLAKHLDVCGLFARVGEPITDALVDDGIRALMDLDGVEAVSADVVAEGEGFRVVYTVSERPLCEEIRLQGNHSLSAASIRETLGLEPGERVDFETLVARLGSIADRYLEERDILFAGVRGPEDVLVDEAGVTLRITEYTLRRVEIRGVGRALSQLARETFRCPIGEPIRRKVFLGSLADIFMLPGVEDVSFEPRFDRERGEVVLVLRLDETPPSVQRASR